MILEQLQIYGYSRAQEQAVLATILAGEACLLMGPPGVAKTELVAAIGAALREDSKRLHPKDPSKWFGYQVYDASKLNFEDLIGMPDVRALQADPPKVQYIPTQSSIWGKDMIAFDELNRCQEDRQSNLFEIIRSRKLYGNPTGNKFIFSTINPFGDTGTIQMSDALVDRHLFYLRINKFDTMNPIHRKKVIARVGQTEALGVKYWGNTTGELDVVETVDANGNAIVNEKLADAGKSLRELFVRAADYYRQLEASISAPITEMIDKLVEHMAREYAKESEETKKETTISGRRASSIRRGILAVRAIQLAENRKEDEVEPLISTIINVTKMCLPIGIGGKLNQNIIDTANKLIDSTVQNIWPNIKQNKSVVDIDAISVALNTKNPIKILDTVLSVNMNDTTRTTLVSALIDKTKYTVDNVFREDEYKRVQALLYSLNQTLPGFLPKHLNITLTPKDISDVVAASESQVSAVYANYLDIIKAKAASLKDNELLYLAYRTGFLHYKNLCKSDQEVIEAIGTLNKFIKSIQDKVDAHKNQANAPKDTKTNNS